MAQPLPSLTEAISCRLLPPDYANAHSTYRLILTAEKETGDNKRLIHIRTLGYLLLRPMSDVALTHVVDEIISCNRDKNFVLKLDELGGLYLDTLLTLFKSHKGRYPTPSEHPSRPSDVLRERYRTLLVDSPRDYSSARKQALLRDDFRCMVTRVLDTDFTRYRQLMKDPEPGRPEALQCCHIFPEALGQSSTSNPAAKVSSPPRTIPMYNDPPVDEHHVASVWTILDQFGYPDLLDELSGTKIHRLDNLMMLTFSIHRMFDAMHLWFEEVKGKENYYRVALAPGFSHSDLIIPEEVQFVAHEQLPLPNPKYLRIHAACCRVAHMSGAADYFDEVLHDMEGVGVLTEDGGSADLLEFLLHRAAIVPPV